MKKVIHLKEFTIRCDACDWEKPATLSREWIGVPCPKCGVNLLTLGDYEAAERLIKMADTINRVLGPWLGKESADGSGHILTVQPRENSTTIWHGEDK